MPIVKTHTPQQYMCAYPHSYLYYEQVIKTSPI